MNVRIQKLATPVDSDDDSFVFVEKKNQKKEGKRKDEFRTPALNTLIKGFRKNTNRDPNYEENAKCVTYLTLGALLLIFVFRFTDVANQNSELKVQNKQAHDKINKLQQELEKMKSFEDHWNIRDLYDEAIETSGEHGAPEDISAKITQEEKVTKGSEELRKTTPDEVKKRVSDILQAAMAVIYIAVLVMALRQMNNRRKRVQVAEKESQASSNKQK